VSQLVGGDQEISGRIETTQNTKKSQILLQINSTNKLLGQIQMDYENILQNSFQKIFTLTNLMSLWKHIRSDVRKEVTAISTRLCSISIKRTELLSLIPPVSAKSQ